MSNNNSLYFSLGVNAQEILDMFHVRQMKHMLNLESQSALDIKTTLLQRSFIVFNVLCWLYATHAVAQMTNV